MLEILQNVDLAPRTSFGVGGAAESFADIKTSRDFKENQNLVNRFEKLWLLGSGSNVLISDKGLPGLTLCFQEGSIDYRPEERLLIADSGVIWEELVRFSLERNLWGIELMSGIPGTLGGAVAININAYGQALADVLQWVEIYEPGSRTVKTVDFRAEDWGYKHSPFAGGQAVILRAALRLNEKSLTPLNYPTALEYAREHRLDSDSLKERRRIILGTRGRAGSLLDDTPLGSAKTCGSFFKNPLVDEDQLESLLRFDETNFSLKKLQAMNRLHGGRTNRVSAAHVLLAAGFQRGQSFGRVRLHPSHVLKIENWQQATATEICQVATMIKETVKMKLDIDMEFEVALLGEFDR